MKHSPIQDRLQSLFQTNRLIFWYDNDGELKEEFDTVSLPDVTKLEIDNNEFTIKHKLLIEAPESKFLIYSPTKEPPMEQNWLLDLILANHSFSADGISMLLQDIGLDVTYKPFVTKHIKFFKSAKRKEKLAELIEADEPESSIALKMLSVAVGSDANFDEMLLRTLSSDKRFNEFEKAGIEEEFWGIVAKRFGYKSDKPTIKDLTYKLLQNYFYHTVDRSKCPLNSEARLFVKSWMDSSRYSEAYEETAATVSEELNIPSILTDMDYGKLLGCDTYEMIERLIITHIRDGLVDDGLTADGIEEVIDKRSSTFWFSRYQNIYHALLYASKLIYGLKNETFRMESFENGITQYTQKWYAYDYRYRNYLHHANHAEHLEILRPLTQKIENTYLNGFLRTINDKWQSYVPQYSQKGNLTHQRAFYDYKVQPLLGKNQKVFVIVSDALRYEAGVELSEKLMGINRYTTEIEGMVCSLPSYTQLGMASLLPHKTLEIKEKDDTVYVDGRSSKGTDNRTKILQVREGAAVAIGDEEFLRFGRDEGREFVKARNVIYIYHNEIDATGDKPATEADVFKAVESSFETITKIIKQIANFNGTNIFVTADHGFLYTNQPTEESEFCKVDTSGEAIKTNRRFIIGKELSESICVQKFDTVSLGLEGSNDYLLAKSINKIRMQGGGNRFVHGGATLQELVIPLISIKKRRSDDVEEVGVEIVPIPTITTNTVNVSLYQSEPVSQKVKPITLKAAFYAKDGTLLSDEHRVTFDSDEEENRNREKKTRFTFRSEINRYNNQQIRLQLKRVLEESSEEPLYSEYEVRLKLSFFNEFDDDF